jgi:hypothetical protein
MRLNDGFINRVFKIVQGTRDYDHATHLLTLILSPQTSFAAVN